MPKVSVIIPTYNRSSLLRRAIQSVKYQTYENWELIVVDDASNDRTKDVVKSFEDRRIRYLRHEKNKGGSAARNTGIKDARGRYVLMLDDDDTIKPNHIKNLVEVADSLGEEWGVVYTGLVKKRGKKEIERHPKYKGNIGDEVFLERGIGTTAVALIDKNELKKVGLFDESLPRHQDWDLYVRLSTCTKFYPIDNTTVVKNESEHANIGEIVKAKKLLKRKYNDKISGMGYWKRQRYRSKDSFDIGKYRLENEEYTKSMSRFIVALAQYPWRAKNILGTLYRKFWS